MKDSRVIFVTGPPGAGKSSLATSLAGTIQYQQMSLDMIRQRFAGDTRRAWLEIWRAIRNGRRVVIDATGASRIFRLVYRAAVFEHSNPLIISLDAQQECLQSRRRRPKKLGLIVLSQGKQITERYLAEAGGSTHADLLIDTTRLTRKQVLNRVLSYLHKSD
jgi:adenylate kinase family enzyme